MIVTGIGSRKITDIESNLLYDIACAFASSGKYTLRSGGAIGSDSVWELAFLTHRAPMEIYLPKRGANGRPTNHPMYISDFADESCMVAANTIVSRIHPLWDDLPAYHQQLHSRNVMQILGANLSTPSDIVIVCTPQVTPTKVSGGTYTAHYLANVNGIPTFNIRVASDIDKLLMFMDTNGHPLSYNPNQSNFNDLSSFLE